MTRKCENKSSVSSKPPTEAQREAGRRYYRYRKALQAFNTLLYTTSGISEEHYSTLLKLKHTYQEHTRTTFKSYTLCPACRVALTGKPFRKATKRTKFSYADCDVCGGISSPHPTEISNRYTCRNTYTLGEARIIARQKAPELFL